MKIRNYLLGALAIILCGNAYIAISAEDLEGVTMKLAQKEMKRGHRLQMRAHEIITDYMLENGDITQDQIEVMKEERKSHREELKQLKKSGDKAAFKARLTKIKQDHEAQRKEMKDYIDSHPELEKILHDKHKERHGENEGKPDGERRGDKFMDGRRGGNYGDEFDEEKRKKYREKRFEGFERDMDEEEQN